MKIPRRRIAQACGAVAVAAAFLPWLSVASESGTEPVRGTSTSSGQLVLVVCLVTVGLIQLRWRPAWIGTGFAAATAIREIFNDEADPAVGIWIAAAACLVSAVLLIWDMFANVGAAGDDPGGGRPGGRGLSGPLGRRRR